MRRIERLYAVSDRLRRAAPATVSAQSLAAEFGVTRRTIERDLVALRLAGAPVWGEPGRSGGTGMLTRPGRSLLSLSDAEVGALVIAAHLASGAPYATAASSAIGKLIAALGPSQRVAVDELRMRCRVAVPDVTIKARVRSVVEDAVREQRVIRIVFVDRNGVRTDRSVEPVGFYADAGVWSLVTWCRLRRAGRMFSLHGIQRATATKEAFAARDVDEVLGWVPRPGTAPGKSA